MTAISINGSQAVTRYSGNTTNCDSTIDAFVNFKPHNMSFNFHFTFDLPSEIPDIVQGYNDYVDTYQYGVVDANVTVVKYFANGEIIDMVLGFFF